MNSCIGKTSRLVCNLDQFVNYGEIIRAFLLFVRSMSFLLFVRSMSLVVNLEIATNMNASWEWNGQIDINLLRYSVLLRAINDEDDNVNDGTWIGKQDPRFGAFFRRGSHRWYRPEPITGLVSFCELRWVSRGRENLNWNRLVESSDRHVLEIRLDVEDVIQPLNSLITDALC